MLKNLYHHIKKAGPLSVYEYMRLCQFHPEWGYYSTKSAKEILGNTGDFITAPEISPLFGEMIGLWVMTQWERMGQPSLFNLIELGPGQGTLMRDIVYTLRKITAFNAVCKVHFIEINPYFKRLQREKVAPFVPVAHYDNLKDLGDVQHPIFIANEFFDALPVHHYGYEDHIGYEIGVDINQNDTLEWVRLPCSNVPAHAEYQPDTEMILDQLLAYLKHDKGAALIIDYGYWEGKGYSLQAVYKHQYVGVLDYPGLTDLSVHVNFKHMAAQCETYGLHYSFKSQRQFLMDLGIVFRLEHLCKINEKKTNLDALRYGVYRLIDPTEMGHLFKTLQIIS